MEIALIITIFLLSITLLTTIFTVNSIRNANKTAPYYFSAKESTRQILKLAELKKDERLYDMGAGDGRVLRLGLKEFGAQGIGFEISIIPYLLSKEESDDKKDL